MNSEFIILFITEMSSNLVKIESIYCIINCDIQQETLIKNQASRILDTVGKKIKTPYPTDIQAVCCQSLPSFQSMRNKIAFYL